MPKAKELVFSWILTLLQLNEPTPGKKRKTLLDRGWDWNPRSSVYKSDPLGIELEVQAGSRPWHDGICSQPVLGLAL